MIKLGDVHLTPQEAARFTPKQRENLRSWGVHVPEPPSQPPTPALLPSQPFIPSTVIPSTAGIFGNIYNGFGDFYDSVGATHTQTQLQSTHDYRTYQVAAESQRAQAEELTELVEEAAALQKLINERKKQ